MMTYLGKIGELTLKGSNIHTFEKLLLKNTKEYLKDTGAKVSLNAGRLYIDCEEKDSEQVEFTLRHLIGITGWAQTKTSEKTIEDIQKTVLETAKEAVQKGAKSFKIEAKRGDKKFPLNSYEIACQGASLVYDSGLMEVNVHNPDVIIYVEVRERCFIYSVAEKSCRGLPVGCSNKGLLLLSGGLDSSLVCAVSAKILKKPIETFAIGMKTDAIDLKYAKQVAEFIHSNHHEIIITKEDVLSSLEDVIRALGTFDITTIRASMGMYLICKAIHEQTDIRVLLTGEISDELFGYKYTDFAPNAAEFQKEAAKRIRELHMYDVLRADRCISVNSLEARVPFGDLDFVEYVMSIDPEMKLNKYNKGKYLLRHAFEKAEDGSQYLPYDILMREKAAFSDAVGHSLVDDLKEYAENTYTDEEFETLRKKYTHAQPFTKESLLYREIFEKYYPGQSQMITDFWMPNKSWEGCNVNDPYARVLSNYGDSGK